MTDRVTQGRRTWATRVARAKLPKPPKPTPEAVFHAFLDDYWPLWQAHKGNTMYHGLRAAFMAGYGAASNDPERKT